MTSESHEVFICEECNKCYKYKTGLYKHTTKAHRKRDVNAPPRKNMYCFLCKEGFYYSRHYRAHLQKVHNRPVETIRMKFISFEDFIEGKRKMEHDTNTCYVSGFKSKLYGKKLMYYRCSRTGKFTARGMGLKKMKAQGTNKINNHCTASMTVTIHGEGTSVCVDFFSTHYGHDIELEHIPLSKIDKDHVSAKLLEGVEPKEILNDIRNTMDEKKKIHLLTKQHIRRIEGCMGLTPRGQKHSDDVVTKGELEKRCAQQIACCAKEFEDVVRLGTSREHLQLILTQVNNLRACIIMKPNDSSSKDETYQRKLLVEKK